MAKRLDLQTRIADDMVDAPVTAAQIQAAMDDAVTYYETQRFTFNEVQNETHTFSASNDVVPLSNLSVTFLKIDRLRMRYSGAQNLTDLYQRDYDWLMDMQDAKSVTRPLEYCVYADAINFDAIPDQAYVGIVDGVRRLEASATTTASISNAWYNEAASLIRYRTKVDLYANIVRDTEEALKMETLAEREFRALKRKLNIRSSGRVRPTDF